MKCVFFRKNNLQCRNDVTNGLPYCKYHAAKLYHVRLGESRRAPGGPGVFANNHFDKSSSILDVDANLLKALAAQRKRGSKVPRVNASVRQAPVMGFYSLVANRDIHQDEEIFVDDTNKPILFRVKSSPLTKFSPVPSNDTPKGILKSSASAPPRPGRPVRRIKFVQDIDKLYDVDWANKLGEGSFGAVYRARDCQTKKTVALKIMRTTRFSRHEEKKLLQEYNVVRGLESSGRCLPNIICYYRIFMSDVGHNGIGKAYVLVMKYIRGHDLKEIIHQYSESSNYSTQKISDDDLIDLFTQLFRALAIIHKDNVAHRDIKPGNIIMSHLGVPYIVDFGLFCTPRERRRMPCTSRAGTKKYMHPEILRDWTTPDKVDSRLWMANDVFAMGVTLWRLQTLRELPWSDDDHVGKKRCLKLPSNANEKLRRIVNMTTCRTLSRVPSAEAVLALLEATPRPRRKAKK